jgi:hypothetical protein
LIRIKKVKIKECKVFIEYDKTAKKGELMDEYSFSCSEEGKPSLYESLKALATHVREMCELPEDYESKITVRGVSFSYGGANEVMGATISASMMLEYSNCDLNLNTPHKASESYSEGPADDRQLLERDCVDALEELQDECRAYIDGDRAQGSLFEQPAA